MKASDVVAKEADAKKDFSPTKSGNSIHRVRNEPERQLGTLRGVIDNIRRNGGTPSVDSIATELSSMHTAQHAPALLALQRTHGNRYVQRVVAGIQAKLKVGQPGDKYEQEADRIAEQVMRMPEPQVQRELEEEKKKEEEEKILQTKVVPDQTPEVTPVIESRIQALRDGGQPLPESVRAFFEPRFGFDFSQVRVHTGAQATNAARELNAQALTIGQDIYFGEGRYQPNTKQGQQLLAHELTHTIQQGSVSAGATGGVRVANHVVDGKSGIGAITAGGVEQIQRLVDIPSWEEVVSGAEELYEEVVEVGEEAVEWTTETAEETVEWIGSAAGRAAMAAAEAIVGALGGTITISGSAIMVHIPRVELFGRHEFSLALPRILVPIPFYAAEGLLGPVIVYGEVGLEFSLSPELVAGIGPSTLHNATIVIDAARSYYLGSADLEIISSIGLRATAFAGLSAHGGVIIPVGGIPIPLDIVSLYGGLQGIIAGWLVYSERRAVTVTYSSGSLTVDANIQSSPGVLLQADLHGWLAASALGEVICQYVYPLISWRGGRAWTINLPISVGASGPTIGPVTHGPIPIEDIASAIENTQPGFSCPGIPNLIGPACELGMIPEELCEVAGAEEEEEEEDEEEEPYIVDLPDIHLFDPMGTSESWSETTGNITLYEDIISLGDFGFAVVQVYARGDALATVGATLGPGVLRNIAVEITPRLTRHRGNGQLYIPASLLGTLTLAGTLVANANWLCLIDVVTVEGSLIGEATAAGRVALVSNVEVIYEDGEISFDGNAFAEARLELGAMIDAEVRLLLFSINVWDRSWRLYENSVGWEWVIPIANRVEYAGTLLSNIPEILSAAAIAGNLVSLLTGQGVGAAMAIVNPAQAAESTGEWNPCGRDRGEPCEDQLPIIWPEELPRPREDSRPLMRIGSGEWDRQDRGPEQRQLRREIDEAQAIGAPIPRACDPTETETFMEYHAHHIQPLFLNGAEVYNNLCAVLTIHHGRGHYLLAHQTEMAQTSAEWINCGISDPYLVNHPRGQHYYIYEI